jgi:hypothetical protein
MNEQEWILELTARAIVDRSSAEAIRELAAERERYESLERSILDLSHPNCKDLLQQLAAEKKAKLELENKLVASLGDDRLHGELAGALRKLAAEREKREGIENRLGVAFDHMVADYQQQLAAALKQRNDFRRALEQRIGEVDELREQVDAEREKSAKGVWVSPCDAINAAIDDARKPLVEALELLRGKFPLSDDMRIIIDDALARN